MIQFQERQGNFRDRIHSYVISMHAILGQCFAGLRRFTLPVYKGNTNDALNANCDSLRTLNYSEPSSFKVEVEKAMIIIKRPRTRNRPFDARNASAASGGRQMAACPQV